MKTQKDSEPSSSPSSGLRYFSGPDSWAKYSLAGLAAFAGVVPESRAALQITDVDPDQTFSNSPAVSFYLDLDHSGSAPYYSTSFFAGADFHLYFSGPGNPVINSLSISALVDNDGGLPTYANRLGGGDSVGPGDNLDFGFFQLYLGAAGPWANFTGDAFLGLGITSGGDTRYGWAQIGAVAGSDVMTVRAFALETTPNTAALISIPEISRPLALALGLGGAAALRFRRKNAAQSAA